MERFRVLPMMVVVGISLSGCADQSSPEPRDVAATPEATRCQAHEECEGRIAYLRDPVPNDSRPGRGRGPSSERTARKVRPPLGVFRRLAGGVEVGAVLPPLSYFYPLSWVIPPRHAWSRPRGSYFPVSKQKKSPSCRAAKPGEHERTHTRRFAFKHLPPTGRDRVPTPEEGETGKRLRPED